MNVNFENAIQRARWWQTWLQCRKWNTFSFFIKFMRFSECCDKKCSSFKIFFWSMKWIWTKYDKFYTFKNKLIHIKRQLFSLFLLCLDDSLSQWIMWNEQEKIKITINICHKTIRKNIRSIFDHFVVFVKWIFLSAIE